MNEVLELRSSLTKLDKEKKALQAIWGGISINNCWETLLVHAPSSLSALAKLMVLAVTGPSRVTVSLSSRYSYSEFKPGNDKASKLKASVIMAANNGHTALQEAHKSMLLISRDMSEIPPAIHRILDLLKQRSSEKLRLQLPGALKSLQGIVEEAAGSTFILAERFRHANELLDNSNSSFGRSGFMLLAEVKNFWDEIISFSTEMTKLIEYTLKSSCNSLVASLTIQFDLASKNPKFTLKNKAREEIYIASLSTVGYALSVRHLADAYLRYSSQFIIPQMNAIVQYPLMAHSEMEMAKAQQQFKEYNVSSKKEMNRILKTNRIENKRKSILELDMGLDVHLSEIETDLEKFLTPIAEFRKRDSKKAKADNSSAIATSRDELSPSEVIEIEELEKRGTFLGRLRSSVIRKKKSAA